MSELKSWQGLPANALPPALPRNIEVQFRPGMKLITKLHCPEAKYTIYHSSIIISCPHRPPEVIDAT